MKKIIVLILIPLIFTSCRRNFATFQASHDETYEKHKRLNFNDLAVSEKKEIDKTIYSKPQLEETKINTTKFVLVEKQVHKPLKINKNPIKTTLQKQNSIIPKKIYKHKRRGDTWWESINVRLKIGVVLLGIAIIFALLSIEVLAIVFGLASIYMIVRGLRKMW